MFISHLASKLAAYDPYGHSNWNALRAITALFSLFTVNLVYSVDNPYFYFFYVPMTCFSIETLGQDLRERSILYLVSVLWSALVVVIFGLASTSKVVQLIVAYVVSLFTYYFFIKNYKYPLTCVATILSLGAYSLNYKHTNVDIYRALYHFGIVLLSGVIVLGALHLFPKRTSWTVWRNIFSKTLADAIDILNKQKKCQVEQMKFFTLQLQHAKLMGIGRTKAIELTILYKEFWECLIVMSYYPEYCQQDSEKLSQQLMSLKQSVEQKKKCSLITLNAQTPMEHLILKLASNWNKLCAVYLNRV